MCMWVLGFRGTGVRVGVCMRVCEVCVWGYELSLREAF